MSDQPKVAPHFMGNSNLDGEIIGSENDFPMLDMQQAYWIGRKDELSEDASAMHMYFEFELENFELDRFKKAWHLLLQRHDMLRAVALENGNQRVLSTIPPYEIKCQDISNLTVLQQEEILAEIRSELSHYKADIAKWPQFKIKIIRLGLITRVAISLDTWCIDGRSTDIIIHELSQLYADPETSLAPLEITFRDYVLWVKEQENTDDYKNALTYWQDRIKSFYDAPKLPSKQSSGHGNFMRVGHVFSQEETQILLKRAASLGVTINGLLLGCFAEVLKYWSGHSQFTLNIPRFNRAQIHPQVNDIVGEIATFSLLSMDLSTYPTLKERIIGLQIQLWSEMEYGSVSGVRILREMMRLSGSSSFGVMPIVFTSAPDRAKTEQKNNHNWFDKLVFSLSQTPQVWLDCQYEFLSEKLYIYFDYIQERFPQQMIEHMFNAYQSIIFKLIQDDYEEFIQNKSVLLSIHQPTSVRKEVNRQQLDYDHRPLYRQLVDLMDDNKLLSKIAIIAGDGELSYEQLYQGSCRLGFYLASLYQSNDKQPIIAILLPKCCLQIISVWGVLAAGGTYLPLDVDQPIVRLNSILLDAKPTTIIVNSATRHLVGNLADITVLDLDANHQILTDGTVCQASDLPGYYCSEDDLIYIMYTSGTTGKPKGVMIEYRGVLNALYHSSSNLFNLADDLVVFGVSALHHDMSVFDVLGTFINKGLLILPPEEERKTPEVWSQLIQKYAVNCWVSVPSIVEMLLTWAAYKKYHFSSLKTVLLGGDWISLTLADRLKELASKDIKIYSVGGPTETTMWNISNEIKAEVDNWSSVPYGLPIPNCSYRILNEALEDVPDWVVGEMYGGGLSLARGYLNDENRTQEKFIIHPVSSERLYRTGDLGFYHPDGRIEFVGRQDGQLKIRGNRIESGEVRAKLEAWPEVSKAIVYLYEERLAVVLQLHPDQEQLPEDELYNRAKDELTSAMIPSLWLQLHQLPLTQNAKVDMPALLKKTQDYLLNNTNNVQESRQLNKTETELADVWEELLEKKPYSPHDNFFVMGGDSLLLVRMLAKIQKKFNVSMSLVDLFTYLTLGEQAEILDKLKENSTENSISMIPSLKLVEYPLTYAQEDMWLAEQMSSGKVRFRIILGFSCEQQLDISKLYSAFEYLRSHHFSLSCIFCLNSQGITQYTDTAKDLPVIVEKPINKQDLNQKITEIEHYCFNLLKEYGWRAHLIPFQEEGCALIINFHHVIFDGWSVPIFLDELQKAYNLQSIDGITDTEDQVNYGDYAIWNRNHIKQHEKEDLDFWLNELKGGEDLITALNETTPIAKTIETTINPTIVNFIQQLSQQQQVTNFVLLLSAVQVSLASFFQKDDFFIGIADSGRENIQTHQMIGCFINNPIFHVRYDAELTFSELINKVKNQYNLIIRHRFLPLSKIVAERGESGSKGGFNPFCQICFVMQPAHDNKIDLGGAQLHNLNLGGNDIRLIYELSCWQLLDEGLHLIMNYDANRAADEEAQELMDYLTGMVELLINYPHQKIQNLVEMRQS